LWNAIQQHNAGGVNLLDVVRVGDRPDLPLGIQDPDLLLWAEREGRVLVTLDKRSMARFLAAHLWAGRHVPGVFMIRRGASLSQVVFHLALAAHADDAAQIQDQVVYIP
jgi:hypothetical protein